MLHGPAGATRRSHLGRPRRTSAACTGIHRDGGNARAGRRRVARLVVESLASARAERHAGGVGRGAVADFGRTGAADLVAHLATAVLARRRGVSVGIGRGRSGLAGRSRGSWRLALRLAGPEGREVLARAVVVESSGLRVAAYRIASLGARLAGGVASDAGVGDAGRFAPPRHHVAGRARRQRQRIVDVRLAGIARTRRDLPAEQAVVALMAKGYDWLNGREDNESWTYVWRALLARKADLPAGQSTAALMARGCDWLNGRDDSESWAFVWQELLAREDDLPAGMTVVALMARGCDWLNTREDNESWTYVWRALLARKADLPAGQSTAALMARGCDWLNGRDDSESWAFVWQELLAREDDLPAGMTVVALMARGCDWLNMREENESWAYVWRELLVRGADLPAGQTVRALIARGCDWLHGHQDSESWTYVWRELLAREDLPRDGRRQT